MLTHTAGHVFRLQATTSGTAYAAVVSKLFIDSEFYPESGVKPRLILLCFPIEEEFAGCRV